MRLVGSVAGRPKEDEVAEIHCADLGNECTFVAEAEDAPGMQQVVMAHAAEAHPDLLANMTPEVEAEIGKAITGAFS